MRAGRGADVKVPAWLNDVSLYHNRGDTTFTGSNSQYGDFFGLDDLFTEDPRVVDGMIDIYKFWIREFRDEPDAQCAAAIRRNARLNDLAQVDVVEAAAAASSGTAELVVVRDRLWSRLASVGDHHESEGAVTVRTVALDDIDGSPPDLIKIDVEGAELDVVAGMARLLRESRPVVVCEMHGLNAEFCAAMRAAGYTVANLDGPEPVEEAGENVHALCTPLGS